MMNEFFTWSMFNSVGSAALATALATQVLKQVFTKFPVRLISYLSALVILVCTELFTNGFDIATFLLAPLNALVVSFASNGGYDALRIKSES